MNAPVRIGDLFKVLLPLDCASGWLVMLRPYFDDSGTHTGGKTGPSKIVVVAGIFGTEARMDSLDRNWRKHLERPLCGQKPKLSRFHMVDCEEHRGEFASWTRTETDYFCHQLRTTIIESEVAAYGIAVSRKDWDEIITGDLLGFLGDAEGYAITQCFVRALRWARDYTFDPKITFVFDSRIPEIERRTKTVGDAFFRHTTVPEIVGTAFLNSTAVRPLQVADMLAWEVYQHANDILKDGGIIRPPKRQSLRQLGAGMLLMTQIAQRESILQIADYIRSQPKDYQRAAAEHFTNFDPSNPDYSHLSGKPPS